MEIAEEMTGTSLTPQLGDNDHLEAPEFSCILHINPRGYTDLKLRSFSTLPSLLHSLMTIAVMPIGSQQLDNSSPFLLKHGFPCTVSTLKQIAIEVFEPTHKPCP
jgi:hypothetical protein